MKPSDTNERIGIVFAVAAYAIWGLLPLYWDHLSHISPIEVTAWRVMLTAVVVLALTLLRGKLGSVNGHVRNHGLLLRLAISASLIALNWTIYVYSIASHQLVEASLGYFILPLISIALGVGLLQERISRFRLAGIALMLIAVVAQVVELGRIPWVALILALSFGFYGYVRKLAPIGALEGLLIETCLLLPFAVIVLAGWAMKGGLSFFLATPAQGALLLCCGPFTALPLTLYSAGIRRIRLSTLGLLQYLSPAISLLIAVVVFAEPFPVADVISFSCVWFGLALVAGEQQLQRTRIWTMRLFEPAATLPAARSLSTDVTGNGAVEPPGAHAIGCSGGGTCLYP
ncbi:MAG: EamA family transporter RarD [Ferrovum sp.]|nr:EamA family transporter RarD [Ferrovum sp.]